MAVNDQLARLSEQLLQQRDELLVQAGLAKLEAKEEWEKTEEQLEHLRSKVQAALAEAKEASEDVLASIEILGEEIKSAYDRIKSRL
jgi:hypothetical protein